MALEGHGVTFTGSNKELVVAYYRTVVGDGRLEEISKFIADSYIDHNASAEAGQGPNAVKTHLEAIRRTFPDFTLQVHEVISEGDWIAVRVTAEGTHLGEWLGIKPTGKRISLRGINLDRVANGLIVEHRGEADSMGMLVQMGLNPFEAPNNSPESARGK